MTSQRSKFASQKRMKDDKTTDTFVCRICLLEQNNNSKIHIFTTPIANVLVVDVIIRCADIKVAVGDKLPANICAICLETLETLNEFRNLIRSSDELLRKTLAKKKACEQVLLKNDVVIDLLDDETDEEEFVCADSKSIASSSATEEEEDVDIHTEKLEIEFVTDEIVKTEIIDGSGETDELADVTRPAPETEVTKPVDEVEAYDTELIEDEVATDDWMSNQIEATTKNVVTTKPTEFNCCRCQKNFPTETAVVAHASNDHHTLTTKLHKRLTNCGGVVECNLCHSQFRSVLGLMQHKNKFIDVLPCEICGEICARSDMSHHFIMKHKPNVRARCQICPSVLASKHGMREHMTKVHPTQKLTCNAKGCGKEFNHRVYLKSHMMQHMKNRTKNVACELCPKKFYNSHCLKNHMNTHTGEKKHQCFICGLIFLHWTDHRRHMWSHNGSPHTCEKCNKSFDRPSKLAVHQAQCKTKKRPSKSKRRPSSTSKK